MRVVFYFGQSFLVGWVSLCSVGENRFSVGLVDELLQHWQRFTAIQPKTVGKLFYRETSIVSTQTDCGWNGWRTGSKNVALVSIQTCPVKYWAARHPESSENQTELSAVRFLIRSRPCWCRLSRMPSLNSRIHHETDPYNKTNMFLRRALEIL